MKSTIIVLPAIFLAVTVAAVTAAWAQSGNRAADDAALGDELGGADRQLMHIETDKPIYRAGEVVYVRGTVLDAHDHRPLVSAPNAFNAGASVSVCVEGPKGDQFGCGPAVAVQGAFAYQWTVPDGHAGGQHKIRVHPSFGGAPAEREFEVRAFRAPRLRQEIDFAREGYGPGEQVVGSLRSERSEGGFPGGAPVRIQARVDGADVFTGSTTVDSTGRAAFSFDLPSVMTRGEGSLTLTVVDGGVSESVTKTIPIVLQTLDISFYPEGGDLVAGVPCGVYVEARTPWGKPADLSGAIVDSRGVEVARLRTEHEGRGRFEFTPADAETYSLVVESPGGIDAPFALPAVQSEGVALRALGAGTSQDGVSIALASPTDRQVHVVLRRIDKTLDSMSLTLHAGTVHPIELRPQFVAGGVGIVTVYAPDHTPLAERLVFLTPRNSLDIRIKSNQKSYAPGDPVTLSFEVRDSDGKRVPATVGVTVSDASVPDLLEDRDLPPDFATMVLLESDVEQLKDAGAYLVGNAEGSVATDLLLGTQGWRRFALTTPTDFVNRHGDAAKRALALRVRSALGLDGFGAGGGGIAVRGAMVLGGVAMPGMDKAGIAALPRGGDVVVEDVVDMPVAGLQAEVAAVPVARPAPAAVPVAAQPAPEPVAAFDDREAHRDNAAPAADFAMAALVEEEPPARAKEDRADEQGPPRKVAAAEAQGLAFARSVHWAQPSAFVRQYAHARRVGWQPGERTDFADTVFWTAAAPTDSHGKMDVIFELSDSVSTFAVRVGAYTADGAIGTAVIEFDSVEPFYAEPKLPLEVTQGDVIELPIAVANGTSRALGEVTVGVTAPKGIRVGEPTRVTLGANERARISVPLAIGAAEAGAVRIQTSAGAFKQEVERPISVQPLGFPTETAVGGTLNPGETFRWELSIPSSAVQGSQTSELVMYASPAGNLTAALERLIQEPYGCFEQTSSTTYPLVMAQQYFKSHTGVDPELVRRSQRLLDEGYKRLKGFECKKRGYEWFGEDPGHEALTAYGLLEFTDMASVYAVDPKMLERTRSWLIGTRDGKGGFERKRRALHTWIQDADSSDAYITWALLESGTDPSELKAEIDSLARRATESKNSYVVAIVANILHLADRADQGDSLLAALAKQQDSDGKLTGATTTIVGSSGDSLHIEATSFATLGWLRSPQYAAQANKAAQWLASVCEGGRYGSTQSTVLALRAILAFDAQAKSPMSDGVVQVTVDGRKMGSAVTIGPDSRGVISLADIAEVLEPGPHVVEVSMKGGGAMPLALAVRYFDTLPPGSEESPLALRTHLRDTRLIEGATTEIEVQVENLRDEPVPSPIAIIGLPGGLEPDHEALKEMKKAKKIAAYEVRGREVILYWREFAAGAKIELAIRANAGVPGTYTAPASRAYLYYGDEHKTWKAGEKVKIVSKT